MTEGQIVVLFMFGFFGGILIGLQFGICIAYDKLKKRLNSKCSECKHFKQCLGFWEKKKDNGECRLFTEEKSEYSKEEGLEEKSESSKENVLVNCPDPNMKDDIKELQENFVILKTQLKKLKEEIQENDEKQQCCLKIVAKTQGEMMGDLFDLDDAIERLEKLVFDKPKRKRKK